MDENGKMRIQTFNENFLVPQDVDLIKINSVSRNVDANLPPPKELEGQEIVFKCIGGQGQVRLVSPQGTLIDDINDYVFDGLWDSIRVISDGIRYLIVI